MSRFGNDSDKWRALSAKMLAMMQVTQGGTQFVYQGQELGLKNFPRTWGIEEYKDVASQNYWHKILAKRKEESPGVEIDTSDILDDFAKKARDHARVPMQWSAAPHAGFTTGTPWMRVNEDYENWNAESQGHDADSVRTFWKDLLRIRKENSLLIAGSFEELHHDHPQVFAWVRRLNGQLALTVLNFSSEEARLELDCHGLPLSTLKLEIGSYHKKGEVSYINGALQLQGYECRLYLSK